MALISFTVGIYYNAALTWVVVYMWNILIGKSSLWARCDNAWNSLGNTSTLAIEDFSRN